MVEMTAYAPGTRTWVDVSTPDMEATKAFYQGLFGWERTESDPELVGYANFLLDGKMVSGVTPIMSPDQPPAWSTYISTDNVDVTARAVQANGGQVVVPPLAVMGLGSMAVFTDPTGAFFGVWQPGTHKGAAVVNEPGALCWNHLLTRDLGAANAFYPAVFGWTAEASGDDGTVWNLDGQPVAGAQTVDAGYPADAPPSWLTYFLVTDTDASATQAQALGGTVLMPAMDTPHGRSAILADPQGAVFAIIQ